MLPKITRKTKKRTISKPLSSTRGKMMKNNK